MKPVNRIILILAVFTAFGFCQVETGWETEFPPGQVTLMKTKDIHPWYGHELRYVFQIYNTTDTSYICLDIFALAISRMWEEYSNESELMWVDENSVLVTDIKHAVTLEDPYTVILVTRKKSFEGFMEWIKTKVKPYEIDRTECEAADE